MKLLMIMSIGEHTDQVRKLLWQQGVQIFSELEMKGRKRDTLNDERENWFGHEKPGAFSNLILVAAEDGIASELMTTLSDYSKQAHSVTPIHAMLLKVEQSA